MFTFIQGHMIEKPWNFWTNFGIKFWISPNRFGVFLKKFGFVEAHHCSLLHDCCLREKTSFQCFEGGRRKKIMACTQIFMKVFFQANFLCLWKLFDSTVWHFEQPWPSFKVIEARSSQSIGIIDYVREVWLYNIGLVTRKWVWVG